MNHSSCLKWSITLFGITIYGGDSVLFRELKTAARSQMPVKILECGILSKEMCKAKQYARTQPIHVQSNRKENNISGWDKKTGLNVRGSCKMLSSLCNSNQCITSLCLRYLSTICFLLMYFSIYFLLFNPTDSSYSWALPHHDVCVCLKNFFVITSSFSTRGQEQIQEQQQKKVTMSNKNWHRNITTFATFSAFSIYYFRVTLGWLINRWSWSQNTLK